MYWKALRASCSIFLNQRNQPLSIISKFKNAKMKQGFSFPDPRLKLFLEGENENPLTSAFWCDS